MKFGRELNWHNLTVVWINAENAHACSHIIWARISFDRAGKFSRTDLSSPVGVVNLA